MVTQKEEQEEKTEQVYWGGLLFMIREKKIIRNSYNSCSVLEKNVDDVTTSLERKDSWLRHIYAQSQLFFMY